MLACNKRNKFACFCYNFKLRGILVVHLANFEFSHILSLSGPPSSASGDRLAVDAPKSVLAYKVDNSIASISSQERPNLFISSAALLCIEEASVVMSLLNSSQKILYALIALSYVNTYKFQTFAP